MGYTTEFEGQVTITPPLTADEVARLNEFTEERHGGNFDPHPGMPSLYCQWESTPDGTAIRWDGGEKFYASEEWMRYLITEIFAPADHVLNGTITAQGEEPGDVWQLVVEDNEVRRVNGRLVFDGAGS